MILAQPSFSSARRRRLTIIALLASGLLGPGPGAWAQGPMACASPDELARLRARVTELEARLAERTAGPGSLLVATPALAPMPAARPTPMPMPMPMPMPAPPVGGATTTTTTTVTGPALASAPAAMPAALPPARTLVTQDGRTVQAIVLAQAPEEPYSHAGCSQGFFKGPAQGPWRDPEAWASLARGMAPAEVEGLLGVEHHDVGSPARHVWEYGTCGPQVAGKVLFVNGVVQGWQAPDNLR